MEERDYKIANHTFCLRMEADALLWENLGAYAPFVVPIPDKAAPIFTLTVAEKEENPDWESLFSVGDFDGDGACLKLFYAADGGRVFRISRQNQDLNHIFYLHIASDYHTATLSISEDSAQEEQVFALTNALMLLYAFTTATLGTLLMHASVVINNGKGYAFLGRSGTGKSTHSKLWLDHIEDSELLNDDNPVIRIENGIPMIYGTPWSGKTPCYKNKQAPLGGIVRLSQAPENKISSLRGVSAYAALSPSLSAMKWEREMADGIHNTLTRLIESTPVYHLQCLPNREAAVLCAQTLKGDMR